MMRSRKGAGLLVAAVALMTACSPLGDAQRPSFNLPAVPPAPTVPPPLERIDGQVTPANPILEIPIPAGSLRPRRADRLDDLPRTVLHATKLSGAPLGVALESVLSDSQVGLVFADDSVAQRPVTVSLPAGSLQDQIAAICAAGRALCSGAGGGKRLEVGTRGTFIVELPPAPAAPNAAGSSGGAAGAGMAGSADGGGSQNSRIGGTRTLGAVDYAGMEGALKAIVGDVKIDRTGRTIVYKATMDEAAEAEAYFDQVRRNQVLILTETIIAEVSFNTSNKLGIHWDQLAARIGGGLKVALSGGPAQLTSSAVGVSGIYSGERLTAGVLLDFLAQEGVVNSVQAPELTALSGSATSFMAGGRQRFVTQVGFPTSGLSSAAGVTINNVANNTVSTESYSLGLNLTLRPQYYNGIVHADVLMEITDLLRTDLVPTGTTVIQNPVTADRNLSSYAMIPPGQVLLLAGIRKKRSDGTAEGLPGTDGVSAPLLTGKGVEQTELVILMRPRVVRFVETAEPSITPGSGKPVKLGLSDGIDGEHLAAAESADRARAARAVAAEPEDSGSVARASADGARNASARAVVARGDADDAPARARASGDGPRQVSARVAMARAGAPVGIARARASDQGARAEVRRAPSARAGAQGAQRAARPAPDRDEPARATGARGRADAADARAQTAIERLRAPARADVCARAQGAQLSLVGARNVAGRARGVWNVAARMLTWAADLAEARARTLDKNGDARGLQARAQLAAGGAPSEGRPARAIITARAANDIGLVGGGDPEPGDARAVGGGPDHSDGERAAQTRAVEARQVAAMPASMQGADRPASGPEDRRLPEAVGATVPDAVGSAGASIAAAAFPAVAKEAELALVTNVVTAPKVVDDVRILQQRWVAGLPVGPEGVTLAQADGRTSALMPPAAKSASGQAVAGVAGAGQGGFEAQDRTIDLATVEQERPQTLLTLWQNKGARTAHPQPPQLTTDQATTDVTVLHDGCSGREIGPGGTCAVKLQIVGHRRGPIRASVALEHEAGIAAVQIRATVEDAMARLSTPGPVPRDLEVATKPPLFGAVPAQRAIVLANRSDSELAIGEVRMVGGELAGFAVAEDGCSEQQALKPGQNCVVVVRFTPPAVSGPVNADLVVLHNGATRQLVLPVSGQGGDGETTLASSDVELPSVPVAVMREGGSSPVLTPPVGGSAGRGASGPAGLRLVGVFDDGRRLVEDGSAGVRVVSPGPVTLAGRAWTATAGLDSITLVSRDGNGDTYRLQLDSFGGRRASK